VGGDGHRWLQPAFIALVRGMQEQPL
jgi:hypothetical protein